MKVHFTRLSIYCLTPILVLAITKEQLASSAEMVPPMVRISVHPEEFALGDTLQVQAEITLEKGWHINSSQPKIKYLVPSRLSFRGSGLGFGPVTYPKPKMKYLKLLEKEIDLYQGTFNLSASVWKTRPKASLDSLQAVFHFQACNDNLCLPPDSVFASLSGAVQHISQANPVFEEADISREKAQSETHSFEGPLWAVVFFLLLGGLALNLTPCVYPLIAITISLFGNQQARSTGSRLTMGVLYVLGMVLSFSGLGVGAALSGKLFGSTLQTPAAQAVIAVVFIILSLSSFGVFEFKLPAGLMGKAAGASNSGGYFGGLVAGLFAGILASPCIGPFILALIVYVAEKSSISTGLWMFATLAFGMGIPYLILAAASGAVQKLPKSGVWMVKVKKILGIVLLALANYYLRGFTGELIHGLILGLLIAGAGFYLFPRGISDFTSRWKVLLARVFAIAVLIVGCWIIARSFIPIPQLPWQPYSAEALTRAVKEGNPALIDFESKIWCAACREMEIKTYARSEVRKALQGFVLLKVDVDKHPERYQLAEQFNVKGIPVCIVLNKKGQEVDRIIGFLNYRAFLQRIRTNL